VYHLLKKYRFKKTTGFGIITGPGDSCHLRVVILNNWLQAKDFCFSPLILKYLPSSFGDEMRIKLHAVLLKQLGTKERLPFFFFLLFCV
jgi:hypothetical protein